MESAGILVKEGDGLRLIDGGRLHVITESMGKEPAGSA
jgi:hypothetical protein